ncbi:MAG TPA: response regulator transcription factor [Dehalococcoidia bacterium]|jgi:DNA-binding NarL/FixJ family response regulator
MSDDIRVMIVDDHDVVREGLRSLLNRREGMTVVAEAGTMQSAIDEALRVKPQVIVMDVRLPDGTGVEACREIRSDLPETRVIMLTSYADEEAIVSSIMAGASGYLLKQTRGQQLADAVITVARGDSLLDQKVIDRVMEHMRNAAAQAKADKQNELTEQEQKILALIAEGKTNREIAAEIYLSDKTVKNYVSSILSKLNLKRRSEAAAYIARRTPERHS